ncbi:hypothetical protein [uncultured Clostridium sp.]|uniref:hypothetical protein n=1 Tax=uncultured Clostridium sp. TaxID=59620 RepID=UPI00261D9298|nr:hypothetical protein [uncultured Clostridium sp.]
MNELQLEELDTLNSGNWRNDLKCAGAVTAAGSAFGKDVYNSVKKWIIYTDNTDDSMYPDE